MSSPTISNSNVSLRFEKALETKPNAGVMMVQFPALVPQLMLASTDVVLDKSKMND